MSSGPRYSIGERSALMNYLRANSDFQCRSNLPELTAFVTDINQTYHGGRHVRTPKGLREMMGKMKRMLTDKEPSTVHREPAIVRLRRMAKDLKKTAADICVVIDEEIAERNADRTLLRKMTAIREAVEKFKL